MKIEPRRRHEESPKRVRHTQRRFAAQFGKRSWLTGAASGK